MKQFLIILSVLLLLGAGYFTYDKWVKDSDLTTWSFVPENSILVYESNQALLTMEEIRQTNLWKNLSFVKDFRLIDQSLDVLDSIGGSGSFSTLFEKSPTLVALNLSSSKAFDFLFIIDIKNLSQQTFISKAQKHFTKKGFNKKTREYEGFTITEMVSGQESFTYIFYKHFFVGSFSAFMVEDAIRTVSISEIPGFLEENKELISLTKLERDQGNIYVNGTKIANLISAFDQQYSRLKVAKSAFLDLKMSNKSINMTGFTFTNNENQMLSAFKNLNSGAFDIVEVIPTNASWFYHYSTTEPALLGQALNDYFSSTTPEVIAYQEKLIASSDFDPNYTYNLLDEEMALVTLESTSSTKTPQLLILEIREMEDALRYFNSLGERHMVKTGDSVYVEQYGNYEIRKLPVAEFPYSILGEVAKGFDETYYLWFRNYLIFSNSLAELKKLTSAVENESIWSKSLHVNEFLELTNREASYSLFVNTPRAWNQLLERFKPEWQEFFKANQFTFRNLEFLALQFSPIDQKFYTNITVYQPNLPSRSIPERITTLKTIRLPGEIATKPWLVTNHNNQLKEVLCQDTSNHVYLVGNDFSVLWDHPINEPIIGDPIQVDYYKNGKKQYAFATASAVHILDRKGAYLPEFPKSLPMDRKISGFNVIDYDNTKKYRFAIADDSGLAYLTDKNVKPLDGWNPKSFKSTLIHAPEHRRVDGKDIIILVEKTGKVWMLNRRGNVLPGFPIEINSELSDSYYLNDANNLREATITLLTISGEIIEINFQGSLQRREQIYKPGTATAFSILKNVAGEGFMILRKTDKTYDILDENGVALFSKDYIIKSPLMAQYYQLGGGNEFIVFVDPGGSYLYLYDTNGNLLTGRPLAASEPVSVMQYENEYQLYRVIDNSLELISISF